MLWYIWDLRSYKVLALPGLAYIAVPAEGWQQAIAVTGAIIVAATAWARLALAAPHDAGQGIAAGVTSSLPLTSVPKEG